MTAAWSNNQWQSYAYDGDGRRVKRVVGGVETWQVYGAGGGLLAEYAAGASYATPQKEYGYRNGQLLITATVTTSGGWGAAPTFADDPLNPPNQPPTAIRLVHLTDLRYWVNQLRHHAGLSDYNFTVDPDPQQNVTAVKADHIRQLRTALEQARAALGLSPPTYEHPTLTENTSWIYAKDFQELRDQIKSAWNNGSGGSVEVRWLVADQLGTPRMIFDQSGSLASVSRHDYLPFGEELFDGTGGRTTAQGYSASDGVRQKFTGYEADAETALNFAQARYQSPIQGRFTSPDELFNDQEEDVPQSWNLYAYVRNNPLKYVDPFGDAHWQVGDDGLEHYVGDKDGEYDKDLNAVWDGSKWNFQENNGQNNTVVAQPEETHTMAMAAGTLAFSLSPPPVKVAVVVTAAAAAAGVGLAYLDRQTIHLPAVPLTTGTTVAPQKIQIVGPAPPPPPLLKKKGERRQIRAAARAAGITYIQMRNAIHEYKRQNGMRGGDNLDWETLVAIGEAVKEMLEKKK